MIRLRHLSAAVRHPLETFQLSVAAKIPCVTQTRTLVTPKAEDPFICTSNKCSLQQKPQEQIPLRYHPTILTMGKLPVLTRQFQQRSKHSSTQVKRIFNKNPARARIVNRVKEQQEDAKTMKEKPTPRQQKFDTVFQPTLLPNGWSQPPSDEFVLPKYPFSISRTKNKPNGAVGFLPIYSDYRNGRTKHTTIIRKVKGDTDAFVQELLVAVGYTDEPVDSVIRIRTGNVIELKGNHVSVVRKWLAGLGF